MTRTWTAHSTRHYSLLLIALVLLPEIAFAANWTLIFADESKELEIDAQSFRPKKSAWFKYIYTPPNKDSCGIGKSTAYLKTFLEANCKDFTIRTKQQIAYTESEEVLTYCGSNTPKATFVEFAPETMGEIYFNAICHDSGKRESEYAAHVRNRKVTARAESLRRQSEAEQAAAIRERDLQRRITDHNMMIATQKPWGSSCSSSSECSGILICAKVSATQMQCMSSDAAIRSGQSF